MNRATYFQLALLVVCGPMLALSCFEETETPTADVVAEVVEELVGSDGVILPGTCSDDEYCDDEDP